jgi:hypothetical protein
VTVICGRAQIHTIELTSIVRAEVHFATRTARQASTPAHALFDVGAYDGQRPASSWASAGRPRG